MLSVDHQSVASGLSLITDQWFIKGYPLWPHAMGAHFFSKWGPDGDPIFSEMGTKWGPSPAEWGPKKRMFAKLRETS